MRTGGHRHLSWLLLAAAGHAATAVPTAADLAELTAALDPTRAPAVFAETARTVGAAVDAIRAGDAFGMTPQALAEMTTLLQARTRARIHAEERRLGDDEAALGRFYRSPAWDDLAYALAAFPYWRAWLEVTRAGHESGTEEILAACARAFRTASLQLHHPDLLYGGWLGLATTMRLRGDRQAALALFVQLETALVGHPDHPVAQAARSEIRLLRLALDGRDDLPPDAGSVWLDRAEAGSLVREAFILLERQRIEGGGARPAAARLARIVAAGHVDEALISRVLAYREQLAGADIGPLALLLDAEGALAHAEHLTAHAKYLAFIDAASAWPELDLTAYRLRAARAALGAGLDMEALEQTAVARRGRTDLTASAQVETARIEYLAQTRLARSRPTTAGADDLAKAATRLLELAPDDPVTGAARLDLALVSRDPAESERQLGEALAAGVDHERVATVRWHLTARRFTDAGLGDDDRERQTAARAGLAAFDRLPESQREQPEATVMRAQMDAATGSDPWRSLAEMDALEQALGARLELVATLFRSRLRLLGQPGREAQFAAWLERQGALAAAWQIDELALTLAALPASPASLVLLDAAVARAAAATPSGLRLRLVRIDHLLALDQQERAYAAAGTAVATHPDSGDAWQRYAAAAEASGRAREADDALARLTDAWSAGSADWWAGMLRRLALRAASTRPEAACRLWDEITARADPPPTVRRAHVQKLLTRAGCPSGQWQQGATARPDDVSSTFGPVHAIHNTQAGEPQPCV